jgi:hypothetical protein
MSPFHTFYRCRRIIPVILLAACASCGPTREESHTEPFGVFLNTETAKLWHEVETRYGP